MSCFLIKHAPLTSQDSTGTAFDDKKEDGILMKDLSNYNIQEDSGSNEDAIEHLWETLRNLSQELTRGVVNNIASEKSTALQDEANRITGCIKQRMEKDSNVQGSVEDLLDTFALVVDSKGLNLDHSWGRLMSIRMNRDQLPWFNETLKGHYLIWKEVRSIVINTYASQNLAQEINNMDKLLSLKVQPNESIEAFTDRFQRIRRAAKWEDVIRTAIIFKLVAKARMILSSKICAEDSGMIYSSSARKSFPTATHGSPGISFVCSPQASKPNNQVHRNNSATLGISPKSSMQIATKTKYNCIIHDRDIPPSHIKVILREVKLSNTENDTYEIEAVINHKGTPGNYLYQVRWERLWRKRCLLPSNEARPVFTNIRLTNSNKRKYHRNNMPRLVPLLSGLTLAVAITYKFRNDILKDQGDIKSQVEDVKSKLHKAVTESETYNRTPSYLSNSQKYVSNRLVPSVKNTWNEQIMNAAQSLVNIDIQSKVHRLWNEQIVKNFKEFVVDKNDKQ
ncbi:uncharacterized protein BX663DRAFT_561692 [Cokeromyces recurvatus]|uniref:uncharacterized protein n=1 Tax=Cokeromyces recurvatus TaxID=90255 RepID=UPI00221FAEEC|nr:uncharacterized protein BX663DRAFT_561692 [Cokeromyces recurvatus]KAI7902104.1 hypothetical protein BX663DRAFT_561692 [Cokeromyces recurvatus]